jgi:hypothetical protein
MNGSSIASAALKVACAAALAIATAGTLGGTAEAASPAHHTVALATAAPSDDVIFDPGTGPGYDVQDPYKSSDGTLYDSPGNYYSGTNGYTC